MSTLATGQNVPRAACHQHLNLTLTAVNNLMEDPKPPASVRLKAALYIRNGATGQTPAKSRRPSATTPDSSHFNTQAQILCHPPTPV